MPKKRVKTEEEIKAQAEKDKRRERRLAIEQAERNSEVDFFVSLGALHAIIPVMQQQIDIVASWLPSVDGADFRCRDNEHYCEQALSKLCDTATQLLEWYKRFQNGVFENSVRDVVNKHKAQDEAQGEAQDEFF